MMSIFVFFLIFGACAAYPLFENLECPLRSGAIGVCKSIEKCPGILKQAMNSFGAPSSHFRCGFEGNVEIVCCPKNAAQHNYDDSKIFFPTRAYQRPTKKPITRRPPYYRSRVPVTQKPPVVQSNRMAIKECERYKQGLPLSIRPNIFDGEAVEAGEIPHMAALGYLTDDGLDFDCGGTLISDRFIVTAAHCIINNKRIRPSVVRMGTVSLNGTFDTADTDYEIKDIKIHPSYTKNSKYNDIALLELATPVRFSDNIYPACMYTRDDDPTARLVVAGWGLTQAKRSIKSNTLLKASLNAVPRTACVEEYANVNDASLGDGIKEQQICAADPERDLKESSSKDTCPGDSGGPLQMIYGGMPFLVGVTSFSRGECGLGVAGVYVRVSKYLDWIEPLVWPTNN